MFFFLANIFTSCDILNEVIAEKVQVCNELDCHKLLCDKELDIHDHPQNCHVLNTKAHIFNNLITEYCKLNFIHMELVCRHIFFLIFEIIVCIDDDLVFLKVILEIN